MGKKERIVRYTAEELDKLPSETDWAKVDAMSQEELERLVREDPDDLFLTDEELAQAIPHWPVDVQALRERLGLSQEHLAGIFDVPVATLRNWEQGHRPPMGATQILLQVIDREPEAVRRALGLARDKAA